MDGVPPATRATARPAGMTIRKRAGAGRIRPLRARIGWNRRIVISQSMFVSS